MFFLFFQIFSTIRNTSLKMHVCLNVAFFKSMQSSSYCAKQILQKNIKDQYMPFSHVREPRYYIRQHAEAHFLEKNHTQTQSSYHL